MSTTTKKAREREIFDLVYANRQLMEVLDSERPDFLVRAASRPERFGVEIAEYYHSQTDARMKRIPDYTGDLLDGKDFRHKDDRRNLDITQVDLVERDGDVAARNIPAILQRVPPLAECARQVASLITQKSEKLRNAGSGLSHINLVIRDNTHLLNPFPADEFFPIYFVPELRNAIAGSPFREIFFVTTMGDQLGLVPLNKLFLLSEAYFFGALLSQRAQSVALPPETDPWNLFASYFTGCVAGRVSVRTDVDGTEVLFGDAGLLVAGDGSVRMRMYSHGPMPADSRPATPELTAVLGEAFCRHVDEFREKNTFSTSLWFPVPTNPLDS